MIKPEQVPFPVGLKIVDLVWLTEEQCEKEGWDYRNTYCPALVLEDGSMVYASHDPEGNGPGMLFGMTKNQSVYVTPLDNR